MLLLKEIMLSNHLDDFEGTGNDESELFDALSLPDDEISGRAVDHVEVDGQRSQAAVAGKPETVETVTTIELL